MEAHHEQEYKKMMEQYDKVVQLRAEKAERKRKSGDGHMQLKLFAGNNNTLSVDNRLDPQLQSRWDSGVVEYISQSGVSFMACQQFDILLRSIWPQGRLRVQVRDASTVLI